MQTLNRAWIPFLLIPSRHQNWMSQMLLLLQSPQGFSAPLVLFLILLNHSLLLASYLVNYCARLGHFFHLCLWPTRCWHPIDLIFFSHPAALGFWSSTPPGNNTLNSANRKADQSLYQFQTGTGVAAYSSLNTEQLISHTRVALVDIIPSLQDSEGGVISISEVLEYLPRFMTFWIMPYLNGFIAELLF